MTNVQSRLFAKFGVVLAALVLALAASLVFVQPAHAATKSISKGTYYTVAKDTWYKFTVKGEGYVTLSAKGTEDNSWASIYLYDSAKEEVANSGDYIHPSGTDVVTTKIAVSEGTYYFKASAVGAFGKIKAKVAYTAVTQPKNYSKATALALKSGTTKTIYTTPNNSFARYFKITLSTAKKINVTTVMKSGTGYNDVIILNSKGRTLDSSYESNYTTNTRVYTTKDKQPKGTYYIWVGDFMPSSYMGKSFITTVKWK